MAKTVDQFSTIEDFRTTFNTLSNDVGDKSGLRTDKTTDLVDAINSVEDKVFFFQEYIYTATNGQTAFSGNDIYDNSLLFRQDRIQVFQIDVSESPDATQLLVEGTHYTIGGLVGVNYNTLTLVSGAGVGDRILIYSFTGSYLGTGAGGTGLAGHWTETVANTIFSNNATGVIINADGDNKTTALTSTSYPIEFAGGKVYSQDDMLFATNKKVTATGGFVGNVKATNDAVILNSQNGSTTATFLGDVTGNIVGVTGTFTGTVQAEQLTTTDDLQVGDDLTVVDDASIGGDLGVTGTATVGTLTDGTLSITGGDITSVDDITGAAGSVFTAGSFVGDLTGDATGKLIGDVYRDDGTTKVLENSTGALTGTVSSISNHNLAALSNVTGWTQTIEVSTPSDGQVLAYSSATSKWANSAAAITYTDPDARNAVIRTANQGGNFGIKFVSDEARLDYETTSTAPTGVGSTATGHLWFVI